MKNLILAAMVCLLPHIAQGAATDDAVADCYKLFTGCTINKAFTLDANAHLRSGGNEIIDLNSPSDLKGSCSF